MKEIPKYGNCFVCGDHNEHGLQARFYLVEGKAVARLVTREQFEGYRGIYHGGVISSMFDEVMIKAILARDVFAVTAEMTVRYQKPVGIGVELTFTGEIVDQKGRIYLTAGKVSDDSGTVYATATGKYLEAKPDLQARLKESVE